MRPASLHFQTFNTLVDYHLARLEGSQLAVLLVYLRFADAQGEAWCGVETLARLAGMNVRNAARAKATLVKSGLLVGTYRGGGRRDRKSVV